MSYSKTNSRPIITTSLFQSNYSTKLKCPLSFPADSPHTKQEFADECNINILMSKYQSTGQLPNLNERAPQYIDATGYDFAEAMNFVAGAQSLFNELPSDLRNRFDNDPAAFLDFCSDEKNRPEMAQLGLLKPLPDLVVPLSSVPASEAVPAQNSEVPA